MGGYGYSGGYSAPVDKVKEAIAEFSSYKRKDLRLDHLRTAYAEAERKQTSLIDALASQLTRENPLDGIEIELKLEPNEDITNTADIAIYKFPTSRFLKCSPVNTTDAKITYFGTDTEERYAVNINNYGARLKLKSGVTENYDFGLENQEYVLKRSEQLSTPAPKGDTTLLDIARAITGATDSDVRERGTMLKSSATQFILEENTGRIYSVVLGRCTMKNRQPLVQLEIEFAGNFTSFPDNAFPSEKAIVQDILDIAGIYMKTSKFSYSRQTKYDWMIGKTTKALELIVEPVQGVNQEFFGQSLRK